MAFKQGSWASDHMLRHTPDLPSTRSAEHRLSRRGSMPARLSDATRSPTTSTLQGRSPAQEVGQSQESCTGMWRL